MKYVGIITTMEKTGRNALLSEVRASLYLEPGDIVELYCENGSIQIRKNDPACIFCGEPKNITQYKGRNICPDCLDEIHKIVSVKKYKIAL